MRGDSFPADAKGLAESSFHAREVYKSRIRHCRKAWSCRSCYFFGYPTDCAKMIFWLACKFRVFASAGLSTLPRTTVASPSEAQ
jgi:hypothetical protein